jgi:hypothetical protein
MTVNLTGIEQLSGAILTAVVIWSGAWLAGKVIDALSRGK